jgi:hypothetical protein
MAGEESREVCQRGEHTILRLIYEIFLWIQYTNWKMFRPQVLWDVMLCR